MPFLTVNPDDSIETITATDINNTGIEITKEDMAEVVINSVGYSLFDYIGGIIVLNQTRQDAVFLIAALTEKIKALKFEAIIRMRQQVLVSNFDEVELTREFWLSIDPASRQPTTAFQWVIDVYQAGRDAAVVINTLTDIAAVEAYDIITAPAWPS